MRVRTILCTPLLLHLVKHHLSDLTYTQMLSPLIKMTNLHREMDTNPCRGGRPAYQICKPQ